jgi:hypothetical protein
MGISSSVGRIIKKNINRVIGKKPTRLTPKGSWYYSPKNLEVTAMRKADIAAGKPYLTRVDGKEIVKSHLREKAFRSTKLGKLVSKSEKVHSNVEIARSGTIVGAAVGVTGTALMAKRNSNKNKKDSGFYGHALISGHPVDKFYNNISNPIKKGKC